MESDSESTGRIVETVGGISAVEAYRLVMAKHDAGVRVIPRRKLDGLEQYLVYRMRGSLRSVDWIERILVEYLEDSDES
jgi:hypothetical protein